MGLLVDPAPLGLLPAHGAALAQLHAGDCMGRLAEVAVQEVIIDIGAMPVAVRRESAEFLQMIEKRYSGFIDSESHAAFELNVEIAPPRRITKEEDISVRFDSGQWLIERGDLRAQWDEVARRGRVMQSANPYSIDTVLRIIHSLILAREGGLLMHAASAVRNRKAFLFADASGAGKTTISRMAPADATLLTDEISYLRRKWKGLHRAWNSLCRRTGEGRGKFAGAAGSAVSSAKGTGERY